ncbi:MarR family transcriptional regulator [Bosea sp. (in: a-proteobacteria)]|jgi:DNA-binding MarR family transcriptional regulator|uniref:MarR family winged helix-turn-helix transcriptional regulator n=1 Tax=Bosea sp. (in: a-proteobacteria) TaxID=1871050 RepID=UPI002DDD549F|nr:MarR family transcriptional regulator [Bosea sp. (in: a-proteobacteria)]HEV2511534.1 MarR family transcriptional regulator [Bosea sp. (in: a-proteobacteria)]
MTSRTKQPPPTVGFLLHDVARLLRKRFEQHARDSGLTRSQWQVLAYLDQNAGIQQGALAELMDVEPITVGRLLDKLESCGLAERRSHATDRRIWQLYLTEKARPKLRELLALGEITRAEAFGDIPQAERDQLLATLGQMKANLTAACQVPVAERQVQNG